MARFDEGAPWLNGPTATAFPGSELRCSLGASRVDACARRTPGRRSPLGPPSTLTLASARMLLVMRMLKLRRKSNQAKHATPRKSQVLAKERIAPHVVSQTPGLLTAAGLPSLDIPDGRRRTGDAP